MSNKDRLLLVLLILACFTTAWRVVSCERYVSELRYTPKVPCDDSLYEDGTIYFNGKPGVPPWYRPPGYFQ